jgi:hypothetical protein
MGNWSLNNTKDVTLGVAVCFRDCGGGKSPGPDAYTEIGNVLAEKTYVDVCKDLRNLHVHPTLKDLKKPDATDYQKLFDNIHRVGVLFRQVTFHLIGYKGPFTDYGAANFPIKQYPLAQAGTTTEGPSNSKADPRRRFAVLIRGWFGLS